MKKDFPRIKGADDASQEVLEQLGPVVLRIKSEVVERDLPVALGMIRKAISGITENDNRNIPSPFMGECKGGG